MKREISRQLATGKRKIAQRLGQAEGGQPPRGGGPELSTRTVHYEISNRIHAIGYGGLGAIQTMVSSLGLIDALHTQLPILKRRRPYSEADHILNLAYNALCGGHVLDDPLPSRGIQQSLVARRHRLYAHRTPRWVGQRRGHLRLRVRRLQTYVSSFG